MSARGPARAMAAALAVALTVSGCAVGEFLAGAPSARSSSPTHVLLARRCGGCHEIPDPRSMSAADWRAGLERMKRRLRLPASEWDSLAAMAASEARP